MSPTRETEMFIIRENILLSTPRGSYLGKKNLRVESTERKIVLDELREDFGRIVTRNK